MKLTIKDRQQLTNILHDLDTSIKYLQNEHTVICSDRLPHSLSYYNKEGKGITPMTKFVGSDLMLLLNGRNKLYSMLYPEPVKAKEIEL